MKTDAKALFTIPFAWGEHEQPFDFARYTSFGLRDLMEKQGFEILMLDKSNHFAEAIIQLWISYLFTLVKSNNRILNTFFTLLLISPFNIAGYLIASILPRNYDYYNNIVLLVKKK